jgi:hypothetical protein
VVGMRAVFWTRDESKEPANNRRETNLAQAVKAGAAKHGDIVEIRVKGRDGDPYVPEIDTGVDMLCAIGVKNREICRAAERAGVSWAYFDKGYDRHRTADTSVGWLEYWRVSCNGHQPEKYVGIAKHDRSRADEAGHRLSQRKTNGTHVLVDGSSAKHWWFVSDQPLMDKKEMDIYANQKVAELIADVKRHTKRPIILRPKQSWHRAKPVPGTEFVMGRKDPQDDLNRSWCCITYGSNLCFDSVLAGTPAIVIGDGIARCVASKTLDEIENPYWASDSDRRQWLNNTAWCQFKLGEYTSGLAWPVIRAMDECSRGT